MSGKFSSVQAAINYATKVKKRDVMFIIYVKRGVYRENIVIPNTLSKIMLVGDGKRYTIIIESINVGAFVIILSLRGCFFAFVKTFNLLCRKI